MPMKLELCGFLLISVFFASAQKMSDSSLIKAFRSSTSERAKISNAFVLAEYYLETDEIQSSQKWLDKTDGILFLPPME
jgi:hypothetical protein